VWVVGVYYCYYWGINCPTTARAHRVRCGAALTAGAGFVGRRRRAARLPVRGGRRPRRGRGRARARSH
jgi:hypothetical protein